MSETDTTILPNDLVEKAIRSYRFDSGAEVNEKLLIHQWQHRQEYGDYSLQVTQDDYSVSCSLAADGHTYTRTIPKVYEDFDVEIYPIGDVRFKKADLVAVSAVGGFPWTKEVFSAFYRGTIKSDALEDVEESFKNVRVLQQYYPPRSVSSEPPECTVITEDDFGSTDFMSLDFRNATHCKRPNPWAYAAFSVLYEDEKLASEFLSHENVYGDKNEFSLTPPKSLNQPLLSIEY